MLRAVQATRPHRIPMEILGGHSPFEVVRPVFQARTLRRGVLDGLAEFTWWPRAQGGVYIPGHAASTLEGLSPVLLGTCSVTPLSPGARAQAVVTRCSSCPQGSVCAATTRRARPVSAARQASMATPSRAKPTTASPARALDGQPALPSRGATRWCAPTVLRDREVSGPCPGVPLPPGLQEWGPGFGVQQMREGSA